MRETLCRAGKVAWAGHHHPCRNALRLFFIRVIRAIRGQIHPLGGGDVSSPLPTPSQPKTFWDETSQPPSRPSITSRLETSRLHTPTPSKPTPSGTRRPSPYPQHQLLRDSRRPVAGAGPCPPWPRPFSPIGRDAFHRVPALLMNIRDLVEQVPTQSLPRPRTQNLLGRGVPAPIQTLNDFGARHQFGTSPDLPQPGFKTLKGFQTVAGGKAARPPPPVPRPQNVQPPPLAEGVGGGGIPESQPAVSPNPSRCPAIPRRRNKAHRGSATGEPSLPCFTA